MSAANAQDSSRRTWLKVLLVLAVLVAAVVVIRALLPKQTIPVRAVKVERGMVRDVVSSSQAGEVTAELHAAVRAEVGGAVVAAAAPVTPEPDPGGGAPLSQARARSEARRAGARRRRMARHRITGGRTGQHR